jgi:quinol monooxygenase YgiN
MRTTNLIVDPAPSCAAPGNTSAYRREKAMAESVIRGDAPGVTLINVFTVEPEDQQRLVEAWQRGTEEVMRHIPGFVSANIHRSLDGTKVVNYAQWESAEAFTASLRAPEVGAYFEELANIGTPAPVLCEVVSVHRASGEHSTS